MFPLLPAPLLSDVLHTILAAPQPRTHTTEFVFDWTPAAATQNLAVIRRYGGAFTCGSCRATVLDALSGVGISARSPAGTPSFASPSLAGVCRADYRRCGIPLADIPDADRRKDVTAALARGNHKSARGHKANLLEMLKDEVKRGWQLPLPKEAALELPHCKVAPLGMVSQTTISADGAKETKLRLTHDQSFNVSRGMRRSVNDRRG